MNKAQQRKDIPERGVGTMIVFVAAVLVAVVAVGVIMSTTGSEGEANGPGESQAASDELRVDSVVAKRASTTAGTLDVLDVYVIGPAEGTVDAGQMTIVVRSNGVSQSYRVGENLGDARLIFAQVGAAADVDGLPAIGSGELARFVVPLAEVGLEIGPATEIQLLLLAGDGMTITSVVMTPEEFGGRTVMDLL